ncbi:DUF6670 family protein [Gordonia neofelifaecis]|uniref:AttH domain-containing protein n=1 Tax=Gordonia neofelifaecis NRRL B-59395 TaxID=644548 RepID=F1YKZ3_9ACTN|nr:DUF6670 family protein [Gordonia neofelifaecis]EGD54787.1 hypothetical protein SCNU_12902 [Gordonia neofelifaecis NRRL B-59395]
MSQFISTALSRLVVDGALPLVDSRIDASTVPYTGTPQMTPNANTRWSMVHYGVFVPKLPDPYRYLNTMTLIGAPGVEIFDNDQLAARDVRNTTTVLTSTAHDDQYLYRAYDASRDCTFAPDGSHLRWSDELTIDVDGDTARVSGRYPNFAVDLELSITDQVSFFVKTPVYDHLSRLAPFQGTITDDRGSTEVSGLGTFEYARATTHQQISRRALPPRLKLPADFFTYQIIEVDERTQLLLTSVSARGRNACLLVHLRVLGEETRVFDDVRFEVLGYDDPLVDEWGRAMRVPTGFRWTARDGAESLLSIEAVPDSTWRFGHGRGYVGAYTYAGSLRGQDISGTGYIEWVDTQTKPKSVWS